MTDTNSDQAPTESTTAVEVPPAGGTTQEYDLLPWGTGSAPSIPTVDNEDSHVGLKVLWAYSTHRKPFAELPLTEHR